MSKWTIMQGQRRASGQRDDLAQLLEIIDDVLEDYCDTCRMAPCVCVVDERQAGEEPGA